MNGNVYYGYIIFKNHLEAWFMCLILLGVTFLMGATLVVFGLWPYVKIYYKNSKNINNTVSGGRSRSRSQTGGAPAANSENNGDDKGKKESWKDWIERNFVYILLGAFTSFLVFCLIAGYLGYGPGETGEISEEVYRRKVCVRSFNAMNKITDHINSNGLAKLALPKNIFCSWDYCDSALKSLGVEFTLEEHGGLEKAWNVIGKKEFETNLRTIEFFFEKKQVYTPEPPVVLKK